MSTTAPDFARSDSPSAPAEALVFVSHRTEGDSAVVGRWLSDALNGRDIGKDRRIRVFFHPDEAPAPDFQLRLIEKMEQASAFLLVSSAETCLDLRTRVDGKQEDWVHFEIDWWLANKSLFPIVVDVTGNPKRYVPDKILRRWPRLDILHLSVDRITSSEPSERVECDKQLHKILECVGSLEESMRLYEETERSRMQRRWRRATVALAVTSGLLLVAITLTVWFASTAMGNERVSNVRRLSVMAESRPPELFDQSLLLAADLNEQVQASAAPTVQEEVRASLINVLSQQPRVIAYGHLSENSVVSVALDSEHGLVAAGGNRGVLQTWHLCEDPLPRLTVSSTTAGYGGTWTRVAFRQGGTYAARVAAERIEVSLPGSTTPIALAGSCAREPGIAFSADAQWLATAASAEGSVQIVSLVGGTRHTCEGVHEKIMWDAAFVDADIVATVGPDRRVVLIQHATSKPRATVLWEAPVPLWAVASSPDGKWLVVAGDDGCIARWYRANGHWEGPTTTSERPSLRALSVAVANSGEAAAGFTDGSVRTYDSVMQEALVLRGHQGRVHAVAIDGDKHILVSGGADHRLIVWDVTEPRPQPRAGRRTSIEGGGTVAVSRDGRRIAWSCVAGVFVGTPSSTESTQKCIGNSGTEKWAVALSPDGQELAVSRLHEATVEFFDFTQSGNSRPWTSPYATGILAIEYSPRGEAFAVAARNGDFAVWSRPSPSHEPELVFPPEHHTVSRPYTGASPTQYHGARAVAFDRSGRWAASAGDDGYVLLKDLDNPSEPIKRLKSFGDDSLYALTFTTNAVVAGTLSGHLVSWSIPDGAQRPSLKAHDSWIWCVSWDPNTGYLYSCGEDGTIRVWDIDAARPYCDALIGHHGAVHSLAVVPGDDPRFVSVGEYDLISWNLSSSALAARAVAMAGRTLRDTERKDFFHSTPR